MKVLVFGNSGSGKSTYARALADEHGLAHLDLDTIVWEPGQIAVQRPAAAIRGSLDAFLAAHATWVIEGCYGELVEAAAPACSELVFLNPGVEACLANNRRRPHEPHKYATAGEQDAMLAQLQAWVAEYPNRDDAWSLAAHRRVYDAFDGNKCEHASPSLRRGQTRLPDGRALGWTEHGPSDGAPIVFCPGAATSSLLGFGEGARIIGLDRPGIFRSTASPGRTLDDWAIDVEHWLAARGLVAPPMVGFSQGAPFALACAARGIVRRAVLVSGTDELARIEPTELRALLARADLEAFFTEMTAARFHEMVIAMCPEGDRAVYLEPTFDRTFRAAIDEAFAQGSAGYARDAFLTFRPWPFDPADIAVPVELFYGAGDTSPVHSLDHGATLATRLPRAQRHVLPGGGALLWTAAREIVLSALEA
jgi:pimeloyl-ACP methyl ester carboxylesterase/adenylate kinase family enzyme